MSKVNKKFLALAAIAVIGAAGVASALTSTIDGSTSASAWLQDTVAGNRNQNLAQGAGFALDTTAGDFTFVQGQGLTFRAYVVPTLPAALADQYDVGTHLAGPFAQWTDATGVRLAMNTASAVAQRIFPAPAEVNVATGQTLKGAVRSAATVEFGALTVSTTAGVATPVRKTGAGNWHITEAVTNISNAKWIAPFAAPGTIAAGPAHTAGTAGLATAASIAGLRIAGGSVQYGTDNLVPHTQAIRFEAPTATLNLADHIQEVAHVQSRYDGDGVVDFGASNRGKLQVHQVNTGVSTAVSAGFLFGDQLANAVTTLAAADAANNATDNIFYVTTGWRGTFAGKGTLELNQATPTSVLYTLAAAPTTVSAFGVNNVLNFPIRLRDANTTLTIKPNQNLDYHRGSVGSTAAADAPAAAFAVTANSGRDNVHLRLAEMDDNWTAARFNGGLLALDSDGIGGHKTHTMAGFVQNVRVDVRTGALRLVATTAGPGNPSAFEDNVFKSLNVESGATFRLDDENAPNAGIAGRRAGYRAITVGGATVARRSVWARVDAISGTGTIDLGATKPEVILTSSPATLRTNGQNFGNAIDFNFTGKVDNYITGNGGIRIVGGRVVTPTATSNDFAGPILVNGTLEVPADHVTGNGDSTNIAYIASGGGIRAVGGKRVIESGLIFDKNSYIYTQAIASSDVAYVQAKGGISLAATVVPGDKIKLTAPAVNVKAGANVIVLQGDGVNTLVDRVLVTDNNGNPVLDKWQTRATANNELVLHALKDVNDADNPNPGPVDPDPKPDPKPDPVDGGGSSGCSTGAFASFAALLLAPLALLRKRD